jgi:hypothetical protein
MSESTGAMEQFNINELAGATGLILGAVSGILVVIFKSRCFCKFRVGISDKYSLCMCERKPPPDIKEDSDGEDKKEDKKVDDKKEDKKVDDKKVDRLSKELKEPEPEPEPILPPQNP